MLRLIRRIGLAATIALTAVVWPAVAQPPSAASQAPATSAFDFEDFEQPDLVRALMESDLDALMTFNAGLLVEQSGIPVGLAAYLKGFNAEISQFWVCPTLMPAGVEPIVARFIGMRSMNPQVWGRTGLEMLEWARRQLEQVDTPSGRHSMDPQRLAAPFVDGRAALDLATNQGQRDARVFWQMTQCTGPEARALANGTRVLMRRLAALR